MTTPIDPGGTYTPPPPPPPPPAGGGGFVPPPAAATPPPEVGTIRIFFIVNLIVNAIATTGWLIGVLVAGASTCGLGCLFLVVPIVTGIATVLDAMAMSKMNLPPDLSVYSHLRTTAILDIVAGIVSGALIPLVLGILALVFLGKPEVARHYDATA